MAMQQQGPVLLSMARTTWHHLGELALCIQGNMVELALVARG